MEKRCGTGNVGGEGLMRDITVFDALFIIKIVKEFIKHSERMRSISNNLD